MPCKSVQNVGGCSGRHEKKSNLGHEIMSKVRDIYVMVMRHQMVCLH